MGAIPKYNITYNDGDASSITVFIGSESHVATADHPSFKTLVNLLLAGEQNGERIAALFNVGYAVADEFKHLSERVTFGGGRLFFDGDEMHDGLAQTIVRFHASGEDFMPLVNFVEKIATNPLQHSRDQLYSWLQSKKIGLCPDGDFIAYKSVNGDFCSVTSGEAYVNGKLVKGRIPNRPDTVIEMPRSKVNHAPSVGCSTGLHAANWSFARGFSSGPMLVLKINPRDVVSVPSEHSADKVRVCRYKVLRQVQAEDTSVLYIPDISRIAKVAEPKPPKKKAVVSKPAPKAKAAPKPVKEHEFPEFYEQFKKADFDACPITELRWIAKEWEMTGCSKMTREEITPLLQREARKILRTW